METEVVDNCVGLCCKGEQNMGWGPLRSIRPRGFVLTIHVWHLYVYADGNEKLIRTEGG